MFKTFTFNSVSLVILSLLRQNSYHIKLTFLKYTIQRHLVHLQCYSSTISIQFKNISSPPKENPIPIKQSLSTLPSPTPQLSLFCFLSLLPIPNISFKQNHTIYDLLCLVSLIQNNVPEIHPHCSMFQYFIPFIGLNNIPLYE